MNLSDISYFFLVTGILLIAYALLKKSKRQKLRKNGIRTEGIIYQSDYFELHAMGKYDKHEEDHSKWSWPQALVSVKYLTKENESVIAFVNQGFFLPFTNQFKPGDKVKLIYNPRNTAEIAIITGQYERLIRWIMILVGATLIYFGIRKYF